MTVHDGGRMPTTRGPRPTQFFVGLWDAVYRGL